MNDLGLREGLLVKECLRGLVGESVRDEMGCANPGTSQGGPASFLLGDGLRERRTAAGYIGGRGLEVAGLSMTAGTKFSEVDFGRTG